MEILALDLASGDGAKQSNKETIEQINEIINRYGLQMTYGEYGENAYAYLTKMENFEQIRSRGAGRKKIAPPLEITVKEIKDLVEELGADHVARKYNISRSTLYRRLKGKADDDEFFA